MYVCMNVWLYLVCLYILVYEYVCVYVYAWHCVGAHVCMYMHDTWIHTVHACVMCHPRMLRNISTLVFQYHVITTNLLICNVILAILPSTILTLSVLINQKIKKIKWKKAKSLCHYVVFLSWKYNFIISLYPMLLYIANIKALALI